MKGPILIVGGGVIGLAVGWELARGGCEVRLFERGTTGREASWKAAGMLAPETEHGYEEQALYTLSRESLQRWPAFAAAVEAESGRSVDYRTDGTLSVADDRDSAEALRRHYEFQREEGLDVQWLSGTEALDLEPFLAPRLAGAVYSSGDHQIDNRLLVLALREAFVVRGGIIHEHTAVRAIIQAATGPAILTDRGDCVEGASVLVAAGAWSREVSGLVPRPPVRPVKGQMVQLRMEAPFALRHVVRGPDAYLAPKSNGRLLIGATSEEMGFDARVTAGALHTLLDGAWNVVPGIYDLELVESWAGFRPGSRDNLPLLGATGMPGVFMATGHYRNGVLLTPVTAEEMGRLIRSGETSSWLEPFSPLRFPSTEFASRA